MNDQQNSSSDEESSRKENIPDNNAASSESPDPMEIENMEVDQDNTDQEQQEEEEEEPRPIRRSLRARAVRARDTTSTESNLDEEEMILEEDNSNDDDEEERVERSANDSNGANTSFRAATPLTQKDNIIHVGDAYQAIIQNGANRELEPEREDRIWNCNVELEDQRLSEYVGEATGRYRIPIDRALYILRKNKHNFAKAISACATRMELRDEWSVEEKNLFSMAFFHFGKNFKKVHAAIPERSLHSIIQHYYNSKKSKNYKTMINVQLNEEDAYDELFKNVNDMTRTAAGKCENCGANSDFLILNRILKRHECKPCILYFKLMRAPRPASLRVMMGRKLRPPCPEFMQAYVGDYMELMKPGNGKASERLGIELEKHANDPVDDECVVLEECTLRKPSPLYIVHTTEDEDPVDPHTCRMTRVFNLDASKTLIENVRKKNHPSVQIVWREKQTMCQEDIALLNEASRQSMFRTSTIFNTCDHESVKKMKALMKVLRERFGKERKKSPEPSEQTTNGSASRSGKVRPGSDWTPEEKKDVVRCFHWYHTDFKVIAEVMNNTKSPDQIQAFYSQHQDIIDKSVQKYKDELRKAVRSLD